MNARSGTGSSVHSPFRLHELIISTPTVTEQLGEKGPQAQPQIEPSHKTIQALEGNNPRPNGSFQWDTSPQSQVLSIRDVLLTSRKGIGAPFLSFKSPWSLSHFAHFFPY